MKRRAYLVAAASVGLAGCTGSERHEPSNDEDTEPDDADGSAEDETDDSSPGAMRIYDDFTDLSKWEPLTGSLTADGTEPVDGSQSVVLEPEPSSSQVVIARPLDDPEDFSTVVPGLTVATDETTVLTIQLYDEDGDRIDCRRGVRGGIGITQYNFGVTNVIGSPDLSAVTEIRIGDWRDDGDGSVRIDDLHFVSRPDVGTVMIQFDDGYETDYTEGLPILEAYGYPAVTFVNSDRIGNDGKLGLEQAEALQDAGWTISNHTASHPELRELDEAEQEAEIRRGKAWLEDHGFERGARYFAYPFGGYDNTTIELVEKHHELGFAGGFPVQGYAVNPQLCTRIGDPSADEAIETLDRTAAMNGITSLFYHELEGDRLTDFEETIDHLYELESAGDVELVMPRDIETDLSIF